MRQRKIKLPAIATWVERRAQRREVHKRWGKLQITGLDLCGSADLCGVTTLQLWRDFRVTVPVNPESGTPAPMCKVIDDALSKLPSFRPQKPKSSSIGRWIRDRWRQIRLAVLPSRGAGNA